MVLWVTLHKNRRVMKHMLFLIILAMLNGISCMASDAAPVAECDTSTIILSGGSGMGGGNRSPQAVPFGASLYSVRAQTIILVTFITDLGTVDVEITNHTTGDYLQGELNAVPGTQSIPISGTPGWYTITFILPDGRIYEGEFDL
mgnify:CR=1 FL=1